MQHPEKEAIVVKDRSGWWAVKDRATLKRVGGLYDTELQAYQAANRAGYIVP